MVLQTWILFLVGDPEKKMDINPPFSGCRTTFLEKWLQIKRLRVSQPKLIFSRLLECKRMWLYLLESNEIVHENSYFTGTILFSHTDMYIPSLIFDISI